MTLEIEVYNLSDELVKTGFVLPGRKRHISQYLGNKSYYYQLYCARNNKYSCIERVYAVEDAVSRRRHIPRVDADGEGLMLLHQGDWTKKLPIRTEPDGPIENYIFVHTGPIIDLSRRKKV